MALRRVGALLVVMAFAGMALVAEPMAAQEGTPGAGEVVLPPDAEVAGLGLGEWSARQWQWFVSFPEAIHPYLDETGERCGLGQSGPVFFLTGSVVSVERTCTVPLGATLYVGLGGAECSTVEPPPYFGRDEAELRACTAASADTIPIDEIEMIIDGQPVDDLSPYRASTPLFTFVFPEGNLFGVPAGAADAVADGYQALLGPLAEGEHVIELSGPAGPDTTERIVTTYRLTVQAAQIIEPEASPEASPEAEATPAA